MSQVSTKTGDKTQDENILGPYTYIHQLPDKVIDTKFMPALNYWLKVSDEKLRAIGEIMQMFQDANILLDDIQDNSILRRGIPVAHSIYGVASTINAANYVMFTALEKTLQLGHPLATTVYTKQLLKFHRGQGIEIYWRDNFQCPSEDEYKEMIIKKTSSLFMMVIRLMQLFSDNKSDFCKLSTILGLYYQIRDDYCNLCLQEYSENKGYCEDLTEGKFSLPIIHAIKNQEDDNQVLRIIRQRTRDVDVKKYCILLLESYGSLQYTRETLHNLDKEARVEISRLGGNPHLEALLDELLNWRQEK